MSTKKQGTDMKLGSSKSKKSKKENTFYSQIKNEKTRSRTNSVPSTNREERHD